MCFIGKGIDSFEGQSGMRAALTWEALFDRLAKVFMIIKADFVQICFRFEIDPLESFLTAIESLKYAGS